MEKSMFPLLLTGTLDPSVFDMRVDSLARRLQEYDTSISRFIADTKFDPIVFIENSGYLFDEEKYMELAEKHGKTFEFLRGSLQKEEVKKRGKGYGDALLVHEALQKSQQLIGVEFFYKMTGRIFLLNSDDILKSCHKHRNEFISYDGMGWVMTWLFKMNREDYDRIMHDVYLECDEPAVRDMEICYWLRLYQSDADIGCFEAYPLIEGNMGKTGTPYTKSRLDHTLRNIGTHLGIFTMKSKTGRLFWSAYHKLTGRKPYVTLP